jgi:hypothetical protein
VNSKRSEAPSPQQVARLERQRRAAEEGAHALKEAAEKAIAVRKNMARLRELRLAKEASDRRERNAGTEAMAKSTIAKPSIAKSAVGKSAIGKSRKSG